MCQNTEIASCRLTYVTPRLGHETWNYATLHANALCQVFEQNRVVCHSQSTCVRKGGLKYAGTSFGICRMMLN